MTNSAKADDGVALDHISIFMVLVLLIIPAVMLSKPDVLLDLSEFCVPPKMLLAGNGAQIYVPDALFALEKQLLPGAQTEVLYVPPQGLPFFLLWSFVPIEIFRPFWWTFLLSCVGASLFVLHQAFQIPKVALVRMAAFVAAFGPEFEIMKHGQIAPILLLGMSLACFFMARKKEIPAALSLSLLFLKPQYLVPTAAFLLGARRFKALGVLAAAGVVLTLIAWMMIGTEGFTNYSKLMAYSLEHRQWMAPEFGPTLRGQLLLLNPKADHPVLEISSACLAAAMLFLVFLGHKLRNSSNWFSLMMIAVYPIAIVTSLHCHAYDLILLFPAIAALISIKFFTTGKIFSFPKIVVAAFTIMFLIPAYAFIQYMYILHGGVWNPLFYMLILLSIAMVITVLNSGKLHAEKKPEPLDDSAAAATP